MLQSNHPTGRVQGWWAPEGAEPQTGNPAFHDAMLQINRPVFLIQNGDKPSISHHGVASVGNSSARHETSLPLIGFAPALSPENLGDPVFKSAHRLTYPYIAGAMANGITTVEMVTAMGQAGMIGFFGAGGLTVDQIDAAIDQLQSRLGETPYGINLIHSPYSRELEQATVDLYLRRKVRRVSAAAFLDLTVPLVHYRVKGIHRNQQGNIVCPNKVIAKVSRIEVARKFFSPPPQKILDQLLSEDKITPDEAELAHHIPVADDLTAEADSGGHTDNRSAIALLPTMLALRDECQSRYNYSRPLCVGLGGGIATPDSAAAAFAMGAAYVLTGTINQACVESGTSDTVRQMLAEAEQADVIMAPSADMFEMGVKVQVLKRGTMFALRAAKLYDIYCSCESLDHIPAPQRTMLERNYFHQSCEAEWEQTRRFFMDRDPRQVRIAETDPKHKMALVFRSYLGQSSGWAKAGLPERKIDYQIWCGPAIGAFNEWTRGTFLEKPEKREVATVAMNLLVGAAVATRMNWLRVQGVYLPPEIGKFSPMPLAMLKSYLTA